MVKRLLVVVSFFLVSAYLFGQDNMKKIEDIRIRDPFVLADKVASTYYLYSSMSGSTANGRKGVQAYKSKDLENWEGPFPVCILPDDFWARGSVWAPEVHMYKNKYYLFVTFTSDKKLTQIEGRPEIVNRASQILVSDSPEGPFKPFKNQPHTPLEWMSLDATLWVEDGKPYMIFCHEWIQVTDGTVELVSLKDDLSETVGKPFTLFKATDAKWVKSLGAVGEQYQNKAHEGYVTDGPFLYRTKAGKLLMIWSSFGEQKYTVGLVESLSGKIQGPWKMVPEPLFKANGGHGMIFNTFSGKVMLVLHQPNQSPLERAKLFELEDTGVSLIMRIKS